MRNQAADMIGNGAHSGTSEVVKQQSSQGLPPVEILGYLILYLGSDCTYRHHQFLSVGYIATEQ